MCQTAEPQRKPDTNCVMCGKKHGGDYYVCDSCIMEYNLTKDQILNMGGSRDNSESIGNAPTKEAQKTTTKKPEVSPLPAQEEPDSSSHPSQGIDAKLDELIALMKENKDINDHSFIALCNIDSNIKTIKSIAVTMFTLFVFSAVILLLVYASNI